jgi:TRAP-type C4-dicarboxylate transport system substrate-binding protein
VSDIQNTGKTSAFRARSALHSTALAMTALALALGVSPANSQPAKITLRVADSLPTNHVFSVGIQAWMKRVTERTNGQVVFQHFPHEQLGKRKDMFDIARNGTADITYVLPVDQPGQLARTTVMELPGISALSACGTPVLWKMMQANANEEYLPNGIRPIFALYVGGYEIFSNKDVHRPADIKGMKIRSAGGMQDVTVKALGAVPIPITPPEVYEAVQRKTLDGVLFPWVGMNPYKLQEVTKNGTFGAALGATALIYVIGEKAYQKLPQNVRDVMAKATEEIMPRTTAEQDKTLTDAVADMKKGGMKVTDLSAAERAEWVKALGDVEKSWMDGATKNGVKNPKAVLDARKAFAASTPGCT